MASPLRPHATNTSRLEDAVATVLPTPSAARAGRQRSPSTGAAIRPTLDSISDLLPTPTSADSRASGGSTPHDVTLTDATVRTDMGRTENPRHLFPTPMVGSSSPASHGQISGDYRRRMDEALALIPTPGANLGDNGGPQHPDKRRAGGHSVSVEDAIHGLSLLPTPRATDGTKGGPNQSGSSGDLMLPSAVQAERFGPYAAAIQRWETILDRPAPSPTEPGRNRPRLSARFVEWLMGLPDGHVTDVPGLTRNQQLKALGNGVVPQQGAAAILHLHEVRATR